MWPVLKTRDGWLDRSEWKKVFCLAWKTVGYESRTKEEEKKYYPVIIIIVTCAREKLWAPTTSAEVYYNDGDDNNNNIGGTTVRAEGERSAGQLAGLYHDE